jgi:hypothetical protein
VLHPVVGHLPQRCLRERRLNQPPQDKTQTALRAMPIAHLPSVSDTAQSCDARRPVQQVAPSVQSILVADPGDLVARALEILAEETEAWDIRQASNVLPGSTR